MLNRLLIQQKAEQMLWFVIAYAIIFRRSLQCSVNEP